MDWPLAPLPRFLGPSHDFSFNFWTKDGLESEKPLSVAKESENASLYRDSRIPNSIDTQPLVF